MQLWKVPQPLCLAAHISACCRFCQATVLPWATAAALPGCSYECLLPLLLGQSAALGHCCCALLCFVRGASCRHRGLPGAKAWAPAPAAVASMGMAGVANA